MLPLLRLLIVFTGSSPSAWLHVVDPNIVDTHSCLLKHYYGTYSGYSVFLPPEKCWNSATDVKDTIARQVIPSSSSASLCWVQETNVEDSLKTFDSENADQLNYRENRISSNQHPLRQGPEYIETNDVFYESTSGDRFGLVACEQYADLLLPKFWKIYTLPNEPIAFAPIPERAIQRVSEILEDLTYDPDVTSIVESISLSQMRADIQWLTGEDPKSPLISRHSFTDGALVASEWILDIASKTGAECERRWFKQGFAPNVICEYPSTSNRTELIVIGAHYDSRGTFGSVRAPGADDDGSGTTSLLNIARTIGITGVSFKSRVQIAFFAGEEQGLLGSKAHAKYLKDEDTDIVLMIQSDMLGYHVPEEPAQLGLQKVIGTPEVAQLVGNVSKMYSPELTVGYSSACCSDHQSFHQQGYPATEVSERGGPIADPMYHTSGDLSERYGFDLDQVRSIAKATFGTVLHAAGYEISG